jgi:2-phosphoglycerate kinase
VFSYQGVADYTNIPGVEFSKAKEITVKVLEDLKNNLMLVPKTCVNFLILKKCTLQEINRVMHHVASKYMLKRSTMGWRIYNILVNALKFTFT